MIDHKKRWGIEDEPNWERLVRKRPITHPIITCWEDVREEDKVLLLNTKKIIISELGDCIVGFRGSRIKGNWIEESDYDLITSRIPTEDVRQRISRYNYEAPIDIMFLDHATYLQQYRIDIP